MNGVERPVREDEFLLALRDQAEAVATRVRHALGNTGECRLAVRIRLATPNPIGLVTSNPSDR
jgi:hypothetical protein